MLRHVIPPSRGFSQVTHEIIRNPDLNSDAVRLLSWQLSLPDSVDEPLSKTAERARIGRGAFLRAKRQLKAAGYFHEWREQGVRGLWATRQLVSNVPLSAEDASALRSGRPTDTRPAAGEPAGRVAGRHPERTSRRNTSNPPPPEPEPEAPEPEPEAPEAPDLPDLPEARRIVDALPGLDPRLRVPRAMLPELAGLAARWLEAGHVAESVREAVARCLPGRSSPIHRPGGLLRYILRDVPPVLPPPPPPRVAALRECESGRHVQPYLFKPLDDEVCCPACLCHGSVSPLDQPSPATVGPALARAALRGHP
ncbi:hypothetical protein Q5762_08295 [Streptomyces sp. P9(2023)]|uniref:hypothetical protein n=1 Tax=Streptomyces sp. P9(2023) TaxID=3064394 RepID=UPI0028F3F48C|nr:hypothetical protein [Streptomyces sp. P9(2023)]MDT9688355.1 hypothetical protein [Streptomyces sp. P9(2023)]